MAFDIFQNQIKSGMQTQDENLLALEEQLKNSPPVIYYNDPNKNGITMLLKDGDIFRYQVIIKYTGKKISLIKDGVAIEYKEEKLKDGEYTVIVTGKDETITRHFIVDANAPKVTGTRTGKYKQAQTITFEDVDDVVPLNTRAACGLHTLNVISSNNISLPIPSGAVFTN